MFDEALGEPITRRSSASLSAEVLERMARIEREQAALVHVLGEWDEAAGLEGRWRAERSVWLAHRAGTIRARAIELVRTARHARSYERTAKALEAGDVSATHVEIMADAANKRDEIFRDDEDSLLDIAPTMPPDEFQVVMRQWRNSADERLLDSGGFDAAARCYLRGTPVLGNLVKIDGMLETDDWATVRAALDPLAKPDAARSVLAPRSAGRRLADALVELARAVRRWKGPGRRVRTTCDVVIDLETLLGRIAAGSAVSGLRDRWRGSDLACHRRAVALRLFRRSGVDARQVGGARPRSAHRSAVAGATTGPRAPRQALPLPRLRSSCSLDRCASPGALDSRRADRPRQPRAVVPSPPQGVSRRRLGSRAQYSTAASRPNGRLARATAVPDCGVNGR